MRRSMVFRSRSSISASSNASRYPTWLFFSRIACSASVPNCEAIIGIRNVLHSLTFKLRARRARVPWPEFSPIANLVLS
jgi:hypothetical protein